MRYFLCISASLLLVFTHAAAAAADSKPAQKKTPSKGVGPVKKVKLGPLDEELAEQGEKTFQAKCMACHKLDQRYVGPALQGVTQRRQPEWIMNMILNPLQMTKDDPVAQELFATYLTQMTFQDVTEKDARALLEYFRSNDQKAPKEKEEEKKEEKHGLPGTD